MAIKYRTILQEARELITPRERWTQNKYARDAEGMGVDPTSPSAVCFCTLGAIYYVAHKHGLAMYDVRVALSLKIAESYCTGGEIVYVYNDTHTHEQVLSALDCALETITDEEEAVEE